MRTDGRSSKQMTKESMPRFFHEPLQAMLGRMREHRAPAQTKRGNQKLSNMSGSNS